MRSRPLCGAQNGKSTVSSAALASTAFSAASSSALGADELAGTKEVLGFDPEQSFVVADDVIARADAELATRARHPAGKPEPEPQVEPVELPTNDDDKYAAHKVTASEINGLASRVRQWQKDLAEKKRLTGGEYIDMDPIIDKVDVLVRMVRDMAFAGECPACQGKGCKECRKLGWVSVGAAKR
jgi:hypothetical protein